MRDQTIPFRTDEQKIYDLRFELELAYAEQAKLRALMKANDDGLAKLLREIEWRGDVFDDFMKVCPFCESDNVVGHREECSLARWIAKVEAR